VDFWGLLRVEQPRLAVFKGWVDRFLLPLARYSDTALGGPADTEHRPKAASSLNVVALGLLTCTFFVRNASPVGQRTIRF
jgi:hypothetical protein